MSVEHQDLISLLKSQIPVNKKLIVAVSGGVDSTALLLGLSQIREEYSLSLIVAHINHRLRDEAEVEERFVASLAKHLGLSFELKVCSSPPQVNIESWGRAERYGFLNGLREKHQADYIVTAHHSEDLVETLLIKLLQNRELNVMQVRDDDRQLLRPLIGLRKDSLKFFLASNKQDYHEDYSNTDSKFLRNRIRHQLSPFLADLMGTDTTMILEKQAKVVHELNSLADFEVSREIKDLEQVNFGDSFSSDHINAVLALSDRSWLLGFKAIDRIFLPAFGFYLGHKIASRVLWVFRQTEKSVNLPGDTCLIWDRGRLFLRKQSLCSSAKKC